MPHRDDHTPSLCVDDIHRSAPPLVFLHYFGGSARTWSEVIAKLSPHYDCFTPDLRGFGESELTARGYAVSDYANDIIELVERSGIKSYVLVGHSMGGKIALAIAARRPANLRSLVLLAPSPPTPEPIPDDERAHLLAAHGDRAAASETLRKLTTHPLPEAVFQRTVEDNLRCTRPAWRAWLEQGSREDISADVASIDVPVLVAAGGKDETMTGELLRREVVARISGARLTTLPEVNHLLPLEAPMATAELIDNHCRQSASVSSYLLARS
ncbi:MAG: alpha/beta hydrolase [Pyrinomonadaceae bacterium]|nr:alpha/beta hydrolase [Pyrinomonadaceae bacterium]